VTLSGPATSSVRGDRAYAYRHKSLGNGAIQRALQALVLLTFVHTALSQVPPLYIRLQPPTAAQLEITEAVSAVQQLIYRPGHYMGEAVWELQQGSVTRLSRSGGLLTAIEFDGNGRTTAETSYELDELGRVTKLLRLPHRGNLTQNLYHYEGDHLTRVFEFVGSVEYQLVYNNESRVSKIIVSHGGDSESVWQYQHDSDGLLVWETAPTGEVVEYEFNLTGTHLATRTRMAQVIHAMTPNERGGLSPTTIYREVESETRVERDEWGRVTQRIRNGKTTSFVFVGDGLAWTERYQINDAGEEELLVVLVFPRFGGHMTA